jgi:hypothetical protein
MTDRRLLVYIDLEGAPTLVGQFWARYHRGKESASPRSRQSFQTGEGKPKHSA